MNKIVRLGSDGPWEAIIGYSRIVMAGDLAEVAGTTATDESGRTVAPFDAYEQTKFIIKKVQSLLAKAGVPLENTVRTRIFLTNIADWEKAAAAHHEAFAEIRPVNTTLAVNALVRKDLVVEMEISVRLPQSPQQ